MKTNKTVEEQVEELQENIYFQKLDELPFSVKHGNEKHSRVIVGQMMEIMKKDLTQALEERDRMAREDFKKVVELKKNESETLLKLDTNSYVAKAGIAVCDDLLQALTNKEV